MKEYAEVGKTLGVKDADLMAFVQEQVKAAQAATRDERQVERERRQAESEAEKERRQAENERMQAELELLAKKYEVEQRAREAAQLAAREEREEETRALAEKLDLERRAAEEEHQRKLELAAVGQEQKGSRRSSVSSDGAQEQPRFYTRAPRPKMQNFSEGKDDIDAYLQRFERFAELCKWERRDLALHLSVLLSGKALEVYARLSVEEAKDYDTLKAALLRRYDLSADGFRRRFHEARREADEGGIEYLCRTSRYLMRWIQLAEVDETFAGLCELLVKEQFLTTCEPGLSIHLRDRGTMSTDELGRAADRYLETRRNMRAGRKESDTARGSSHHSPTKLRVVGHQRDNNKCFVCDKVGHMARNCPQRFGKRPAVGRQGKFMAGNACVVEVDRRDTVNVESRRTADEAVNSKVGLVLAGLIQNGQLSGRELLVQTGHLGGRPVKVMRDTGCTGAVVRRSLVTERQLTGKERRYRMIDGTESVAPVARVYLESPYYSGSLEVLCVKEPLFDVIVGNVEGAAGGVCEANAVVTRAQHAKKEEPYRSLRVRDPVDLGVTCEALKQAQVDDGSLKRFWELETRKETVRYCKGSTATFMQVRGLLYRMYADEMGKSTKQLVVPEGLRQKVVSLAHDSILTGHLGMNKTSDRILSEFYWPGLTADVARYCRSCEACQRTVPKGRVSKAPLQKMPLIGVPFDRVAMDLVGPIHPASGSGNRYILTVVDYATRYPEAVALPSIESERVAECLLNIYTRVGIPREILTDQGTQFVSEMMAEVSRLLSVNHLTSSPYHPQCNGLVERFNGTLKQMLRRLCVERPKDWDRYIEAVLFAYREVPQDSLGFSPFELLYGRAVRGPMSILRELWTKETPDCEVKTTYQYVVDLRNRIEETCKWAQESLAKSQGLAKRHFDKKARLRSLNVGDQVLILRPTSNNKLLMQWKGPFPVVEKVGPTDYRIEVKGRTKVYHINMLKQYFRRQAVMEAAAMVLEEDEFDAGEPGCVPEVGVELCESKQGETFADVHINPCLEASRQAQLVKLLEQYSDIFTDVPGSTDLAEHRIELSSSDPVRLRPYPLPYNMRVVVEKEVQDMLKLGVIEPTSSPYSSPLHLVRKKDGSFRPVVDFRRLNRVTVFDAEPMPNIDEIYSKLASARVFSKLDFTKGYWQIPMRAEDKVKTAFTSTAGSFQFIRMPFGLVNSGATYNRMMRRLLDGQAQVDSFVDDVLVHTANWEEHLVVLGQAFHRIRDAHLTVKPSKCAFGYDTIDFVGHRVGQSVLQALPDKVEKILKVEVPQTKKQVRAFLGLAGYYRKFVPDYAAIAVPLTDLTKKGAQNQVVWSDVLQRSFEALKRCLSTAPVLQLPDWDKTFIVRTDASNRGLGAVLLQDVEGEPRPVAYISRKLLKREENYSAIEKECLGIVWAVERFQPYLYGREFVLQTDHKPLTYMDKAKLTNARVMRWALALQPFRYRLQSIRGRDNVGADLLSRTAPE